ncbi:unnamed protein product, partial [Staurois parvus]
MTRDCEHSIGDDQRLRTVHRMTETTDIVEGMTRDCGQEMTRDCEHST